MLLPSRGTAPRRLGIPFRLLAIALVVVVGYVAVTFAQVVIAARTDSARPSDAIVVLGAAQYDGRPSPVFQARLDHAADLHARGLAPIVVVTGGRGDGDDLSEANAADAYLQRAGVPAAALRLETGGRTSYESLAASARFLRTEGVADVLLVSDGWHLARASAIAREVGLDPVGSPSPGSPYSAVRALEQMARETAGLAMGRLIGFRRLDNLLAG